MAALTVLTVLAAVLLWLLEATGWATAGAYLGGGTMVVLGVAVALSPGRFQRWGRRVGWAASPGRGRDFKRAMAVGSENRVPGGLVAGISIGRMTGGAVAAGASIADARTAGAPIAPRSHRQLHEYAEDPLTPAAADTLTDGLERLFLRLGPPPGAAPVAGDSVPAPRDGDR
ncbi:hypothetical protein [Kitasatospora sp. NPDC086791]|uniref:hypothetical protein n=1 Tax=Kitasatospora sp. NPDC086791 TaxID=3155178 RepID=UPI0034302B25